MKNSRSLDDLLPRVKLLAMSMLQRCKADPWFTENGIDIIVTSTLRDHEAQEALYAQGRTKPGKVVTKVRGGYSMHNFACAFDVVPTRYGVPIWGTKGNGIDEEPGDDATDDLEAWERVGAHGRAAGLEWGGDWPNFQDRPHFQYTGGLTMAQLREGAVLA